MHAVHQNTSGREDDGVCKVRFVDAFGVRGDHSARRPLPIRRKPADLIEVLDARQRHGLDTQVLREPPESFDIPDPQFTVSVLRVYAQRELRPLFFLRYQFITILAVGPGAALNASYKMTHTRGKPFPGSTA